MSNATERKQATQNLWNVTEQLLLKPNRDSKDYNMLAGIAMNLCVELDLSEESRKTHPLAEPLMLIAKVLAGNQGTINEACISFDCIAQHAHGDLQRQAMAKAEEYASKYSSGSGLEATVSASLKKSDAVEKLKLPIPQRSTEIKQFVARVRAAQSQPT